MPWLWLTCVKPILQAPVSEGTISTVGELSRIWWVGTGSPSLLPFHATSEYVDEVLVLCQSCLDKGIFSYTPTIKLLGNARERAAHKTTADQATKIPRISYSLPLCQRLTAIQTCLEYGRKARPSLNPLPSPGRGGAGAAEHGVCPWKAVREQF